MKMKLARGSLIPKTPFKLIPNGRAFKSLSDLYLKLNADWVVSGVGTVVACSTWSDMYELLPEGTQLLITT